MIRISNSLCIIVSSYVYDGMSYDILPPMCYVRYVLRKKTKLSIKNGWHFYRLYIKFILRLRKGRNHNVAVYVRDTQCALYTRISKTLISCHRKAMNVPDLKYEPLNTEDCIPMYYILRARFTLLLCLKTFKLWHLFVPILLRRRFLKPLNKY